MQGAGDLGALEGLLGAEPAVKSSNTHAVSSGRVARRKGRAAVGAATAIGRTNGCNAAGDANSLLSLLTGRFLPISVWGHIEHAKMHCCASRKHPVPPPIQTGARPAL